MEEFNTRDFQLYEKCRNFCAKTRNMFSETDDNYRFYNGDQWKGLETGGLINPVSFNFIKPVVKYKTNVVNSNGYGIVFSPNNFDNELFQVEMTEICEQLNEYISIVWEQKGVDSIGREIIRDACINSEGIMYLNYDLDEGEIKPELINKTNVFYSNENNSNIQDQEYILITYRRSVNSVKEEAKANGIPEDKIRLITDDSDTQYQAGEDSKEELDHMVLVVHKFFKKNGTIWHRKSTRDVVIQEEQDTGMKIYPIAHFVWEEVKGSARGTGEVKNLIPNQIETNKTLLKRLICVTMTAFPKLVIDTEKIGNAESVMNVGTAIETRGQTVDDVRKVAGYLTPAGMSADITNIQNELMEVTRDLSGAGDSVVGDVNPERASGQAILAVKQASEQSLTEHIVRYKDFLQDVARIIFEMWQTYTEEENGKKIVVKEDLAKVEENNNAVEHLNEDINQEVLKANTGESEDIVDIKSNNNDIDKKEVYVQKVIPKEIIEKLKVNIKIDISPNSAFDKFAREQCIENLLKSQIITFEEYAKYLPPDSVMPKDVLTNILRDRKEAEAKINALDMKAELKKQEIEEGLNRAPLEAVLSSSAVAANVSQSLTLACIASVSSGSIPRYC